MDWQVLDEAVDQGYIRPPPSGLQGEGDTGLSRGPVGENSDGVDGFGIRAAGDQDPLPFKVGRAQQSFYLLHHPLVIGEFGLALLDARIDEGHAHFPQDLQIPYDCGMTVHGLMHGRDDCHRLATSESRGSKGGHWSVIDAIGHLANGVGGGRRDQEEVCLSAHAAELDVLNPAGDLGYHRMV